jgi:hypothetical protein
MNLFITLLENVNKSRTSANNVSLIIHLNKKRVEKRLIHPSSKMGRKTFNLSIQTAKWVEKRFTYPPKQQKGAEKQGVKKVLLFHL